jgi:hypothetical protein
MPSSNAPTPDDFSQQAMALLLVYTFENSSPQSKMQFVAEVVAKTVYQQASVYQAIASAAHSIFNITLDAAVLHSYVDLLLTRAPNKELGAFMKRVHAEPALRKEFLAAATSYDSLAAFCVGKGVKVTSDDLRNYVAPWTMLTGGLQRLLDEKKITKPQFETYAGFASDDGSLTGLGHDVDIEMMRGILSASGWATKKTFLEDAKFPIGVLVFASAPIILNALEGRTMSFGRLGDIFKESVYTGLEAAAQSLEQFRGSVKDTFGI